MFNWQRCYFIRNSVFVQKKPLERTKGGKIFIYSERKETSFWGYASEN